MTTTRLARRALLQSGAMLAGPLALAGVWPQPVNAASAPGETSGSPLTGTLAGWVMVEPDRGAAVRLVQLDAEARPIRQVAADLTLSAPDASLRQLGQRAHAMALEAVARSWRVPKAECVASHGRIAHAGTGREVGYTLWVDIA